MNSGIGPGLKNRKLLYYPHEKIGFKLGKVV